MKISIEEKCNGLSVAQLVDELPRIVDTLFPEHPFSGGITPGNARFVLGRYLAMSQAFPYLQSGSQRELIFDCIDRNMGPSASMQLTTVVANFLSWDETGGHRLLLDFGLRGLEQILETKDHFHSELLAHDAVTIFRSEIVPDYTGATQTYLHDLYRGLANLDSVVRVAAMVAFESHAGRMIEALWESISDVFGLAQNDLDYFLTHVGGADPAEPYHVAMTRQMVVRVVPEGRQDAFLDAFLESYTLHIGWCRDILVNSNEHSYA